MTEDKLTDTEKYKINKLANRMARYSVRAWIATLAALAAAVWFTDWRLVGLAALAALVGAAFLTLSNLARDPEQQQRFARDLRDRDRAKQEQEAHVRDLERDLGLGGDQ